MSTRPHRELTDGERVLLIERHERVRVLEATVREARDDLALAARIAFENGASVRKIGEALGLSPARSHELIRAGEARSKSHLHELR